MVFLYLVEVNGYTSMFFHHFLLRNNFCNFLFASFDHSTQMKGVNRTPDKKGYSGYFKDNFSYFSMKTYAMTNH